MDLPKTLLCADIGGTKCDLAIIAAIGDYVPLARKRYACTDFNRLEDIVHQFLSETGETPQYACLAIGVR